MIDISVEDLEGRTEKEEIWKFVEHLVVNSAKQIILKRLKIKLYGKIRTIKEKQAANLHEGLDRSKRRLMK